MLASACGCRGSAPRHWDDERLEKLLQLQLLAYIKSGRRLQAAIVERWKLAAPTRGDVISLGTTAASSQIGGSNSQR